MSELQQQAHQVQWIKGPFVGAGGGCGAVRVRGQRPGSGHRWTLSERRGTAPWSRITEENNVGQGFSVLAGPSLPL